MNYKKILLIVLIAIIGLSAFYFFIKQGQVDKIIIEECGKEKVVSNASCYAHLAIEKNDYLICNKIRNLDTNGDEEKDYALKMLADTCISAVAKKTKDINICDYVKGEQDREFCFLEVNNELNDLANCEKVKSENRDSCYFDVAAGLKDINICNKIQTDSKRKSCIEYVNNKINLLP